MRVALVIILLALSVSIPITSAQSPTYFYAWDSTSGQVISYDLDGNITPLLVADEVFPPIWNIGNQAALGVMSVNGAAGIYHLTPTSAQLFSATGDIPYTDLRQLAAQSGSYAVLVAENGAFNTGVLLDVQNHTATRLTGEGFTLVDNWRFSADGAHLRYLTHDPAAPLTWILRERRLDTGNERIVYQFDSPYPAIDADVHGETWLYSLLDSETNILTHVQVDLGGNAQQIAQQTLTTPLLLTAYQIFQNERVTYTAPCRPDCVIRIGSQSFFIPELASTNITPIARVNDQRVLVMIDNQFWLLKAGENATSQGIFDAQVLYTFPEQLVSPDGRWLLSVNSSSEQFTLTDLTTETVAVQGEAGVGLTVRYAPGGILLQQLLPPRSWLYRDDAVQEIPGDEGGFYFTVLDDGSVLQAYVDPDGERPVGIYRYDPVTQATTPVITGYFPLNSN